MNFLKANKMGLLELLDFLFALIRYALGLGIHKDEEEDSTSESGENV